MKRYEGRREGYAVIVTVAVLRDPHQRVRGGGHYEPARPGF
jgi:hypothetical protein